MISQLFSFLIFLANILQMIFDYSHNCWNETITLAEKCEESQSTGFSTNFSVKESGIGESYYRLAMFYLHYLDEKVVSCSIDTEALIIKSILRGMRYHSKNARLLFPRLLQLSSINQPATIRLFNKEVYAAFVLKLSF